MRQTERNVIRALPLFQDVSETHFEELVSAAFLQQSLQGATLFSEGDLPDFLHIVVDGAVELFGVHDGHETTIDIIRPVTTFVLAAVIRDATYLESARTLAPAQIVMIPAETVRDVYERDAAFVRAIVKELAECYQGVVRSLKDKKLRNSAERLANWILQADAMQGNQRSIELTFDKHTLASRLGMTPENLSRNFALLTKYGVRSFGCYIVIEDPLALERFAKPNALMDS